MFAGKRLQAALQRELLGKPALSFLEIVFRDRGVGLQHLGNQITGTRAPTQFR